MKLLEVDGLKVHFDVAGLKVPFDVGGAGVRAVAGGSFSLEAGRTLGLVGESGCGKSMTALALMRLIPSPPARIVSGEIRFEGGDVVTMDAAALRALRGNRIAMIYQDP